MLFVDDAASATHPHPLGETRLCHLACSVNASTIPSAHPCLPGDRGRGGRVVASRSSKARIYETVNSHYADLVHALSFSEGVQGEIEGLVSDLEAIENEARQGKLATVIESKAEQRALAKRLATTKATTKILQMLCKIDTQLRGFDDQVECGKFDRAAEAIHGVSELVAQLEPENENGCDPKIFSAIRTDLRRKRSKLKSQLEEMWRKAIVWGGVTSTAAGEPRVQIAASVEAPHGRAEVPFGTLLTALKRVGSLEAKIEKFGALMFDRKRAFGMRARARVWVWVWVWV